MSRFWGVWCEAVEQGMLKALGPDHSWDKGFAGRGELRYRVFQASPAPRANPPAGPDGALQTQAE
eukprot:14920032-Alexandrium_andersonii.AAC.1